MKILRISGKNLASLAGDFCVDFEQEPLASSGLFAISGPTGAGKSTLLDALCLALYDATPRLLKQARGASYLPDVGSDVVSAQDPRTLLRRGSAEAHAEVDFIGNDDLRYRARWSVRRSRAKAAGALQKSAMTLHRLSDMAALGGTKSEVAAEIEQRIGLSFEQFTRAVLLAQNEFSAFLKTEENERGELLETLTGSTIYTAISRRAFERYKLEQEAMRQLGMRLAEHAPMASDARLEIDAAGKAADEALAALDAARATLELKLRWRQELDKLHAGEAQAGAALALASAAHDEAGPRRLQLATMDAAQAARPLLAELARLASEAASLSTTTDAATNALQAALAAQQQAGAALALSAAQVHAAEQAQRDAAPLLDQAKTLDARIETLAPAHAAAVRTQDVAQLEHTQAVTALAAKQDALQSLRAEQEAGAAWLAQHQLHESLAATWPRWDTLLTQAGNALATQRKNQDALALARTAQQAADKTEAAAASAFTSISEQLQQLETARQQAMAALSTFDGDQLRTRRQALDTQRNQLASAEKTWTELEAATNKLTHVREQAAQLAGAQTAAETALAASRAELTPLAAALAQAERSLRAAELACAASVEDLRSRLVDDEPCPVCGSADHPYQHQNADLHDMLASLQGELERCRTQVQEAHAEQAAQRTIAAASATQLAAVRRDLAALEASLDRVTALWEAHPLASEAVDAAWFSAQNAQLAASIRQLDTQELAMREATRVREGAQLECDAMAARHARQQEQLAAARTARAQATAACDALLEKQAAAAQLITTLLAELDGAFSGIPDWQHAWQAAPAQFHSAREDEVRQWRERSLRQSARAGKIVLLESELAAVTAHSGKARQALESAQAAFAQIDAAIGALRTTRHSLFDGQPAAAIEQALNAAIEAARGQMAGQQTASQKAAEDEARARTTLAHLEARGIEVARAYGAAEQRLAEWIAQYPQRHPGLDPIAGKEQLAALFASDETSVARERAALQALDAAVASAATVLAERRSQRQLHACAALADDSETLDGLCAALDALAVQRKQAHDTAATFKVQIAQDDLRRSSAQSMMAAIERQQLVERRWGQLNELIGSADGKKFRNYAQQFTLDVLLGYANSHLHHLARRYRLERVASSAGPSLGLMVRDQDMGGEVRSVNSLSGGESFLVSLALALGLASLSSNRVRVESLFIDEGFGSLDSDTLRVAMDALDGLQSMGRKVGVISHVHEMTERIATKILVQPAGGGTSSVTVQ